MRGLALTGLDTTYRKMIATAIRNQWWDSAFIVQVNADNSVTILPPGTASAAALNDTSATAHQFQLIEYNFSLIWGLAAKCTRPLWSPTTPAWTSSWMGKVAP